MIIKNLKLTSNNNLKTIKIMLQHMQLEKTSKFENWELTAVMNKVWKFSENSDRKNNYKNSKYNLDKNLYQISKFF